MVTRILVPTDGSDPATAALEHALDVAADYGATVHLLYVADTNQPSLTRVGAEVVDSLESEGEEILAEASDRAADRDVAVSERVVQGDPRQAIVDATDETAFDLVAMGAHGRRGLGEYVLGSVTEYVVNRSDVPVVTVRDAEDATRTYPYDDVLIPTDGSPHALAAVELGSSLAKRHDATVHLLSVVDEHPEIERGDPNEIPDQLERSLRTALGEDATVAERTGAGNVRTDVRTGSVPREVTSYVDEEGIDLVVMGTHGRTGIDRHLIGSFTDRVIRTSPVPVLSTTRTQE